MSNYFVDNRDYYGAPRTYIDELTENVQIRFTVDKSFATRTVLDYILTCYGEAEIKYVQDRVQVSQIDALIGTFKDFLLGLQKIIKDERAEQFSLLGEMADANRMRFRFKVKYDRVGGWQYQRTSTFLSCTPLFISIRSRRPNAQCLAGEASSIMWAKYQAPLIHVDELTEKSAKFFSNAHELDEKLSKLTDKDHFFIVDYRTILMESELLYSPCLIFELAHFNWFDEIIAWEQGFDIRDFFMDFAWKLRQQLPSDNILLEDAFIIPIWLTHCYFVFVVSVNGLKITFSVCCNIKNGAVEKEIAESFKIPLTEDMNIAKLQGLNDNDWPSGMNLNKFTLNEDNIVLLFKSDPEYHDFKTSTVSRDGYSKAIIQTLTTISQTLIETKQEELELEKPTKKKNFLSWFLGRD